MKSITLAVSKGGVGKSLLTANIGAALAQNGKNVVLVEGDPNQPLQKMLGIEFSSSDPQLEDIIEKDLEIDRAVYPTAIDNLSLLPSGVSLQGFFEIDPVACARKLISLTTDFMLVDVPFPLGKAAFLSLGICDHFIPILTEHEFVLCVESAIDTIRLGRYFLKSTPIGFVFNRIKSADKFTKEFIEDVENLLEIPCITKIREDSRVLKSYGIVGSKEAFVAYNRLRESEFAKKIDEIATWLISKKLEPEKKDVIELLQEAIRPLRP